MEETKAKYHHLIPQTYMSSWANQSGTLNIEFLNKPRTIVPRNKEKIAGITDYYSIKVGMPICAQSDTDKFFSVLSDYCVEIDGNITTDTMEMNRHFYDFDNWRITRKDETLVSKKSLRREIEKIKIKDIEINWSIKYENKWDSVVNDIEKNILNTTAKSVPMFHKDYLMKFFVALNWRGFQSNQQFEETFKALTEGLFDKIDIPFKERQLPQLETAADELRHELLLKFYRQYLEDRGVIFAYAEANLQNTGFHFLISDGPTYFDTSDSPSFMFKRNDGLLQGIMPITPRILLGQGKCTDDTGRYYISHITEDAVQRYNAIIRKHALEFIIHVR